jgi:MFS family permease
MVDHNRNNPILSIILFITIVTLISSISNMISPNLLIISNYFGFGGDTTPLGTLTFIFMIITGITMLLFGYLADKFIRKWIVLCGTLVFSLFSLLIVFTPVGINGYAFFFFMMIMNGIGYGALIPSMFSLIGDIISQKDRSKGYSFFSISSLIGMVLGAGLATFSGPIDWRLSYFIIGIAGFFSATFFTLFREPSRIGRDYDISNNQNIAPYPYRIRFSDYGYILKKRANIWLVVNFVDTIPTGIILFLLYAYMKEYHGILPEGTLLLVLLILLSTLIGTIVFGFVGDREFKKGKKRARVWLALIGNIAPIPFIFIALILPFRAPELFPGIFIWLTLFMIGIFLNGAVNGNWYAIVADINLPEHRGTVLATANFFDIIGKAIGPLIGAIIADTLGFVYGMTSSIFFWVLIPFFWIGVLKNVVKEMDQTREIFIGRLDEMKREKEKNYQP